MHLTLFLIASVLHYAVAYKALVFGDWGQERTSSSRPAQELTARAMGKYLEDNPDVEYIVTTGDNFYGDPPNSPDSERFDSSWREVYWLPEYPVMTSLDWYLAVGNHDHTDSFAELSQIAFGEIEPQWIFPHLWHDWIEDRGDFSVHWVVIDTQSIGQNKHDPPEQFAWFESTLASSTADYLMVIGHHTIYSAGRYASSYNLREDIQPLLEQYHADMYLCGHEHNLQHVQHQDAAELDFYVDYVVTGGGGRVLYELNEDSLANIREAGYELMHFEHYYGVTIFDFSAESVTVDYYSPDSNEDMQLVYSFTRPKMRPGRK